MEMAPSHLVFVGYYHLLSSTYFIWIREGRGPDISKLLHPIFYDKV